MLNIIITNQVLIKICKYLVKLFKFLNKYLFILSLISLLNKIYAKFKENKFYYAINWTIKIILILTLITSTGIILDFTSPINTTFSIY